MDSDKVKELMEKGIDYLDKGWASDAVGYFEEVINKYGRSAAVLSWLGLAMAMTKKGDMRPAEKLCLEAIKKEHFNALCYRNLAHVYLIWGKKKNAIKVLRRGVSIVEQKDVLVSELQSLGLRQSKAVSFLSRSNPINKYIGSFRYRIASRHM